MIMVNYRAIATLQVALRASGNGLKKVSVASELATKCINRGSAVNLRKVKCDLSWYQSCSDSWAHVGIIWSNEIEPFM